MTSLFARSNYNSGFHSNIQPPYGYYHGGNKRGLWRVYFFNLSTSFLLVMGITIK